MPLSNNMVVIKALGNSCNLEVRDSASNHVDYVIVVHFFLVRDIIEMRNLIFFIYFCFAVLVTSLAMLHGNSLNILAQGCPLA